MDTEGQTLDLLLTPHRDRAAAEAFLRKAMRPQGRPAKITLEQSGSNPAAIQYSNRTHPTALVSRHSTSLNTVVAQDQRAVKRITHAMLGFKSVWAACCTIAGIEVRPALHTRQVVTLETRPQTPAEQCSALAA